MNRFVFVVFTFPMLPLPLPLSGTCLILLLLLTHMPSPCGDTHFHGQQQWKPMSAQSSPGSCLLLSPAPHFHDSSKGFLSSHGCLHPWLLSGVTKRCHFCWFLQSGCPHTFPRSLLHPDSLETHMCTERRESPLFQERQGKLSEHLAPETSALEVRCELRT